MKRRFACSRTAGTSELAFGSSSTDSRSSHGNGRRTPYALAADAHAMEKQAIESVENQIARLKNYPELRNWAQEHVEASEHHRELIKQCIQRRGGSTSTLKNVTMAVMGKIQEISGAVMADEVLKNVIGDFSFKHYQIASYKSLIAAAEAANDPDTKQVCEGILATYQQQADRLSPYIGQVTHEFIRREEAGGGVQTLISYHPQLSGYASPVPSWGRRTCPTASAKTWPT